MLPLEVKLLYLMLLCFSTLLFVRFFRARYAEKAKEVAKPRRTDIRIREEKDRPQKEKGVVRTKHHMKMGLRKASETTWLSHDTKYDVERTMRQRLIQEKGSMVIGCSPGFEKACEEALHLIVEDLTNSYPQYFLKVKSKAGDEYVEILGSNMVIPINGPGRGDVPALKVAAELVVEDLNILMKDKEGDHILRASVTCYPVGWSVDQRLDWPLYKVHSPVPRWRENLGASVERFLSTLKSGNQQERVTFFVQVASPRLGLADTFCQLSPFDFETKATHPESIIIRSERQTFRRLPKTGAVLFAVKTSLRRITDLRMEELVLFSEKVASWPEDIARYKGRHCWGDCVHRYCNERLAGETQPVLPHCEGVPPS